MKTKIKEEISLKEYSLSFLQLVSKGKVKEAFNKYVGVDFIHHNPFFKGDRESLMKAMEVDAYNNPDKILEVKKVIEENNTVVVYSYVRQNPKDKGWAIVHIFRFLNNKIIELWDISQEIPLNIVNDNGMF